jgi:hypothetical protein
MVYWSQMGSGTIFFTRNIVPSGERGSGPVSAQGHRAGDPVIIQNPEDLTSVDAFAVSGVTVGTVPVQVINAIKNPLPRSRSITLINDGTAIIRIANSQTKLAEGFPLYPVVSSVGNNSLTLPVLKNVDVWAASDSGNNSLRMIFI